MNIDIETIYYLMFNSKDSRFRSAIGGDLIYVEHYVIDDLDNNIFCCKSILSPIKNNEL